MPQFAVTYWHVVTVTQRTSCVLLLAAAFVFIYKTFTCFVHTFTKLRGSRIPTTLLHAPSGRPSTICCRLLFPLHVARYDTMLVQIAAVCNHRSIAAISQSTTSLIMTFLYCVIITRHL